MEKNNVTRGEKKFVQNAYHGGSYGHPVDELAEAGLSLRFLADYLDSAEKEEYGLAFML